MKYQFFAIRRVFGIVAVMGVTFAQACSSVRVQPAAEHVLQVDQVDGSCLAVDSQVLREPTVNSLLDRTLARKNIIARAKNHAAILGGDRFTVSTESTSLLSDVSLPITIYACGVISEINLTAIKRACDFQSPEACGELAVRSQAAGEHFAMLGHFKTACELSHKPSCKWLDEFRAEKASLRSLCIDKKDAGACLAGARYSVIEQDEVMMMTFLTQGCSYGHSESCFNRTMFEEQKAADRQGAEERHRRYMIQLQKESNYLQQESIHQQQVSNALLFLNSRPQTCVSRKGYGGTIVTDCN